MRRREFIAALGGAVASSLAARAQQAIPLIGYLSAGSANTTLSLLPFLQGLRESGFVEGQNVNVEYRWADGQYDRLPAMAVDLVNRRVAVISTTGGRLWQAPPKQQPRRSRSSSRVAGIPLAKD